jgi:hypothetical protein
MPLDGGAVERFAVCFADRFGRAINARQRWHLVVPSRRGRLVTHLSRSSVPWSDRLLDLRRAWVREGRRTRHQH